jgi:hypothetical protein
MRNKEGRMTDPRDRDNCDTEGLWGRSVATVAVPRGRRLRIAKIDRSYFRVTASTMQLYRAAKRVDMTLSAVMITKACTAILSVR